MDGQITPLAGPVSFEVERLRDGALKGATYAELAAFRKELEGLQGGIFAASLVLDKSVDRINAIQTALSRSNIEPGQLDARVHDLKRKLMDLEEKMNGNQSKEEIGERNPPTLRSRFFVAYRGLSTTYGPTPLHRQSLAIAKKEFEGLNDQLNQLSNEEIPDLEKSLMGAGAPWIEGQALPEIKR